MRLAVSARSCSCSRGSSWPPRRPSWRHPPPPAPSSTWAPESSAASIRASWPTPVAPSARWASGVHRRRRQRLPRLRGALRGHGRLDRHRRLHHRLLSAPGHAGHVHERRLARRRGDDGLGTGTLAYSSWLAMQAAHEADANTTQQRPGARQGRPRLPEHGQPHRAVLRRSGGARQRDVRGRQGLQLRQLLAARWREPAVADTRCLSAPGSTTDITSATLGCGGGTCWFSEAFTLAKTFGSSVVLIV